MWAGEVRKGSAEEVSLEPLLGRKCRWMREIRFHDCWCSVPPRNTQVPFLTHIGLTVVRAAFWKRSGLRNEHEVLRHQLGCVWRWWKAWLPETTFIFWAQINLHQNVFAQYAALTDSPELSQIWSPVRRISWISSSRRKCEFSAWQKQ